GGGARGLSRSAAGAMGAVPVEEGRDVFVTRSNVGRPPDTTPAGTGSCGQRWRGPTPVDSTRTRVRDRATRARHAVPKPANPRARPQGAPGPTEASAHQPK